MNEWYIFYINRNIPSENCFIKMDRVLLINEIFLSLPNQLLSIEYQQSSCVLNITIWLIIHFIITRLIDTYLLLHILVLFHVIMILIFYRYWRRIKNFLESNWSEIYDIDRYSLMIIVLKKEMKLIFVYVYVAFVYTWLQLLKSNYTVTYLNFLRWLIEAALIPQILIFALSGYFFLTTADFFQTYHLLYVPTIIIKVPLFILMRYTETQSDFFLNAFQISLFNRYCYFRWK